MLRKNEGVVDRTIRVAVGLALATSGLLVLDGLQGGAIGIAAAALGVWFVVTGAIGVCPAYMPFGINTLGRHGRVPGSSQRYTLDVQRTREGAPK
jgi:hypothetical protein